MKPVARFTRLNATEIVVLTDPKEKVQESAEVETAEQVVKSQKRSLKENNVPYKISGRKLRKKHLNAHVHSIHERNHRCAHEKCSETFLTKLELTR